MNAKRKFSWGRCKQRRNNYFIKCVFYIIDRVAIQKALLCCNWFGNIDGLSAELGIGEQIEKVISVGCCDSKTLATASSSGFFDELGRLVIAPDISWLGMMGCCGLPLDRPERRGRLVLTGVIIAFVDTILPLQRRDERLRRLLRWGLTRGLNCISDFLDFPG